jgi:hypothetical protein
MVARKKHAPKIPEGFETGITLTRLMPELAADLLARLRRNEIDIPVFVREAEKLSEDDWKRLSSLIMRWFAQQKTDGLKGFQAGGDATNR